MIQWNLRYTVSKTASAAAGVVGTKITYTLTVVNSGANAYTATTPASFSDNLAGVLDDATYNNDATSNVAGWTLSESGTTLTGNGPLAVGQTATITYSVTINAPDTGNALARQRRHRHRDQRRL